MADVTFRFYEELNDFLPQERQKVDFTAKLGGERSVKDMIESLGVPHTEVDLILVNGESVDFQYTLQPFDRVSVYPLFETLNVKNVTRLRIIPLRQTRFIADVNLGDIAKYMRMLGFDVYFNSCFSAKEIIKLAQSEKRIILTTSKKLLKHKEVTHGIFLRSGTKVERIKKIIAYLDIKDLVIPFSRCLLCNYLLEAVEKNKVADRVPPKSREIFQDFSYCATCNKIFWSGSHYEKMKQVVDLILTT